MTVGGSRIDGAAALGLELAQFYAERCYLDQVSLGQLLELYQYREGKEESALARFVNELLGLEQLDALRSGLSDATDFRRLKKLSEPLADAEAEAHRAEADLVRLTKELETARHALAGSREELAETLGSLGLEVPEVDGTDLGAQVTDLLRTLRQSGDRAAAEDLNRSVAVLGGRIQALSNRPSVRRLEDAKAALTIASSGVEAWRDEYEPDVKSWREALFALGVRAPADEGAALDDELRKIDQSLARQDEVIAREGQLRAQLAVREAALLEMQSDLATAQERVGSLAEGLAALRDHSSGDICPVCDRDFREVASIHLRSHIDRKIAELTNQGARLRELREKRDALSKEIEHDRRVLEQNRDQLLSKAEREAADSRRARLKNLSERLGVLRTAISAGEELRIELRDAEAKLAEVEAITRDATVARSELEALRQALGEVPPEQEQDLIATWRRLSDIAQERLDQAEVVERAYVRASDHLKRTIELGLRVTTLRDSIAEAAERKTAWEHRVQEARRRQAVARAVHDASSKARSAIVQRVFTESLNEVWRSVFTRLAPREPFIPAFGIPTSSKTALELTLETVHASGESAGPPQMMLSAGNLNTAALSLFIALHLAVEPLVPCLVFDDPVQSMDEVHVAQFAGLIRVLAKRHGRQVIVAVHERELFQYLALELSPAFEGDELITIELGARGEEGDRGVRRVTWSPDPAIAV